MKSLLLLSMLFCHIIDDYYLQGLLASLKQKKWWDEHAQQELYKKDYLMALFEHAFSWSFMIHIPIIAVMVLNDNIDSISLLLTVIINTIAHAVIDDMKANKLKINLIQDQLLHFGQILATMLIYAYIINIL